MRRKARVLLVVGGITTDLYFRKALETDLHFLTELYKDFDAIIEIDTNKHRDRWSPKFIDNMPWTDVLKLYINPFRRGAIHKIIEQTVKHYQSIGFEVHVAAHSLGTVELAGSKINVKSAFFFGSPLGMRNPFGAFCRNRLAPIPLTKAAMKCDHFTNFWSKNDIVGTNPILGDYRCKFGKESNNEYEFNCVHDLPKYVELFAKEYGEFRKGGFN
jgi:hypothetical protein